MKGSVLWEMLASRLTSKTNKWTDRHEVIYFSYEWNKEKNKDCECRQEAWNWKWERHKIYVHIYRKTNSTRDVSYKNQEQKKATSLMLRNTWSTSFHVAAEINTLTPWPKVPLPRIFPKKKRNQIPTTPPPPSLLYTWPVLHRWGPLKLQA